MQNKYLGVSQFRVVERVLSIESLSYHVPEYTFIYIVSYIM